MLGFPLYPREWVQNRRVRPVRFANQKPCVFSRGSASKTLKFSRIDSIVLVSDSFD